MCPRIFVFCASLILAFGTISKNRHLRVIRECLFVFVLFSWKRMGKENYIFSTKILQPPGCEDSFTECLFSSFILSNSGIALLEDKKCLGLPPVDDRPQPKTYFPEDILG